MPDLQGSQHCSVFWQLSTVHHLRKPSVHLTVFSGDLFVLELDTAEGILVEKGKIGIELKVLNFWLR